MASGDLPNWAVALMTGGTGLIGAIIGAAVGFFAQVKTAKASREAERNAVAAAFAAEITAFLTIVERRGHLEIAEGALVALNRGEDIQLHGFGVDKDDELDALFPVMKAMLPKIGLLGPLAGDLSNFYMLATAIRSTARSGARGEYDAYSVSQKYRLIKTERDLYFENEARGRKVAADLSKLAANGP